MIRFLLTAALFLFLLTGCATYHISSQSFAEQLNNANKVNQGFLIADNSVKGNDLQTLKCLDKSGREVSVSINHRTGIRITKTDSTRVTFYANTVLIKDSAITGSKTHFFNASIHPIKLSEVSRIEIMP